MKNLINIQKEIARYSVEDVENFIKSNDCFYVLGTGFETRRIVKQLLYNGKKVLGIVSLDKDRDFDFSDIEVFDIEDCLQKKAPILLASLQEVDSLNWELEASNIIRNKFRLKLFGDYVPLMGFFMDMEHKDRFRLLLGKNFNDYYVNNLNKFKKTLLFIDDSYSKDIFIKVLNYKINSYDHYNLDLTFLPVTKNKELYWRQIENKIKNIFYNIIKNKRLLNMFASNLSRRLYEYNDIVTLKGKKVIFDIGAYNGDTAIMFSFLAKEATIFAFEPVSDIFCELKENTRYFNNIIPIKCGIWSRTEKKYIKKSIRSNYIGVGSFISEEGDEIIHVTSIDDFVESNSLRGVDYIKIDIEGAEIEALKGAKKTIEKFKPDLAICIYHKVSHMWEIPLWIKDNFPFYKIYIDHKNVSIGDTICYATIHPNII